MGRVKNEWQIIGVGHDPFRFYVFLTSAAHHSAYYRHVNVVELKPGSRLPSSIRSREVKQVLLRTIPLRIEQPGGANGPAIYVFTRAEKVINKLNNMTLSLQIADFEGTQGVKNLFDHLWKMETDDEYESTNGMQEVR